MEKIFKLSLLVTLISYQFCVASHQPDHTDTIQYYTAQPHYQVALQLLKGISNITTNIHHELEVSVAADKNPDLKVGYELYRSNKKIVFISTLELKNSNTEEIIVTIRTQHL